MANDDLWNMCSCGREFATVEGFAAHKVSLHDAEPNPIENKVNDDKIRAEEDIAFRQYYRQLLDFARDFSADQRKKAADSGAAMSDGSYPIKNQSDANNAWKLRNNGKASSAAVVAHIRKRVKTLGLKMPGTEN